jgi:hypothetical protein
MTAQEDERREVEDVEVDGYLGRTDGPFNRGPSLVLLELCKIHRNPCDLIG